MYKAGYLSRSQRENALQMSELIKVKGLYEERSELSDPCLGIMEMRPSRMGGGTLASLASLNTSRRCDVREGEKVW